MICGRERLSLYLQKLKTLSFSGGFTKADLLTANFHLAKDGDLDMFYSPHNEYINPRAVIAISGITPGFSQMQQAYKAAAHLLKSGASLETIAYETKKAAGLSGSMRQHIIEMLNECGLPAALDIEDSSQLFDAKRELLHTTSVIKHPVFYKHKNYTGHRPTISSSALLSRYALKCFPDEIEMIKKDILLIPLGKAAETACRTLKKNGRMNHAVILEGFPHPSGANGHRFKQFDENKQSLREQIQRFDKFI
ncbi:MULTISPECIES: hypothetical protein [Bacillus amyloliquefaciens group]|uniref:hypothetical protein n=1 Tax=Bacillus amyloliquefaciens group TaxID=1938374 RepID=UPI000B51C43E|nr:MULTISPECIES: hypothetical protein [Bacillus amyloliquefaciens group]ASF29051.1 hypothetical protein WV34_09875 [Bacillus amyloliquefaciens]MDQ8091495.1 hypothetical protein [Bacillus amyloliquefaciens]